MKGGEFPCGTTWEALSWRMSRRRDRGGCEGPAAVPLERRRTKQLTGNPMTSKAICELVKRRLKDAGLPDRLSPHTFRVAAVTDLLDARRAAGGCAIPGRACGAANDRALRPAAEEGDAEHRRADFELASFLVGRSARANRKFYICTYHRISIEG